jgi:cell pole-organizing protein PopZ
MNQTIAFIRPGAGGTPEIVVNFGPLTGREATLAEIDRLARRLLDVAARVRVHAVRTHDMTPETETIVHQVVAEADADASQGDRLRDICEDWAVDCAEERSLEPLGH